MTVRIISLGYTSPFGWSYWFLAGWARYDEKPECAFGDTRLNFAIHVRMGDRRTLQGNGLEYFQLLENFMETVSEVVLEKGLEAPLFHIFSETVMPCPSESTGAFEEFPAWPIAHEQVRKKKRFPSRI